MTDSGLQLLPGDALIVVDVQNDFLPGGALAVADGDRVIPAQNRYIRQFESAGLPIFATRDWHPGDHCSFTGQGGTWPPHCIANTVGAEFAHDLALPATAIIISKAQHRDRDAYSGFQDTELHQLLQRQGVRRLFIGGLATDYCVADTVTDALRLGYQVVILEQAVRPVDATPGDGARALRTMREQGAMRAADLESGS